MQNNLEDNNLEQAPSVPIVSRQLDKSQKIAVAVLAFFAIFVIIIWIAQTKRSLSDPFDYKTNTVNQSATCIDGNCGGASEADLRAKDTDKDGLSDYDELNVYNTSPYLEDSDSDGYSDKQEVESQNDPICPFGQQCHVDQFQVPESKDADIMPVEMQGADLGASGGVDVRMNSAEEVLGGQSDPVTLRAVLLEAGMDQKSLEQISDDELMKTYQDILSN
jgi:hypothetical protein